MTSSIIQNTTQKVTQFYHPIVAFIGIRLPSELNKSPKTIKWSDERPQIHNLMFSLNYPQSDICREFEKKNNIQLADLEELREELKPYYISRMTYDDGSTHRRDYWSFYQTKITPGTPKVLANLSQREEQVDKMRETISNWLKRKSINIHLPFTKPYLWTFEVQHDSRVVDLPVRDRSFFKKNNNQMYQQQDQSQQQAKPEDQQPLSQ